MPPEEWAAHAAACAWSTSQVSPGLNVKRTFLHFDIAGEALPGARARSESAPSKVQQCGRCHLLFCRHGRSCDHYNRKCKYCHCETPAMTPDKARMTRKQRSKEQKKAACAQRRLVSSSSSSSSGARVVERADG
mmetsp:Transcript_66489/g.183673  ORF Transcript_66489/g.183673 Transcript_66489/m.183673 type:complete len:134 (-) Transcript_66489:396-797(-)